MNRAVSMRGVVIDMAQVMAANEDVIAIGNGSMNARGDLISRGKIVKRREAMIEEYYQQNPKAVKQVSLRNISPDVFESPAAAAASPSAAEALRKQTMVQQPRRRRITDRE